MYYIEYIGEEFVKYEVSLEEKKLEELRDKIIRNCGEIVPHCYQGTKSQVNPYDLVHISNYNEKFIRWYQPNDFYSSAEKIYEFSYEEYKDTKLSLLIDSLLKGDVSAITEIKNLKLERRKVSLKNPKKDLSKLLSLPADKIDTKKMEKLKKELENYQYYRELNKNQKSEREYSPLVFACINMTEIERYSISKVMEYQTLMQHANNILEELKLFFIGTNHEDILTHDLKKEL